MSATTVSNMGDELQLVTVMTLIGITLALDDRRLRVLKSRLQFDAE
jgi:hypothetical protein